ncbi:Rha family transcriptional regulator [Marinobacter adhaerens]|uniref:Rha family transcriptional regulator n=1 Tax=Marinobacter adhaerens TaxID=1033846 RepID=A0A851HYG1_9GAMM|nr:Rha family transcriptional regulator [Marinobacter adhaerens]NWN92302.1 Rha family transcriptional regulator [Marinobacter adhaerens]
MTTVLSAKDLIVIHQNQPLTTSLKVAEAFGKLHKDVLRKINSLGCSEEFASAHFYAHDEITQAGAVKRKSKVYEMTKDGFMFLVMGFTGKKAAQIKEAYINAFNEMAGKLYGNTPTKKRKPKALPNGLTLEQQDTIKSLVKARVDALPPEKRAKAAITCWSSLKSKFGCTYKEIEPENFTDAVSLVARVTLDGDFIPAGESERPVIDGVSRNHLYCLITHMERLNRYWIQLMPALRAMESAWAPRLHDHIQDGACIAGAMRRAHSEALHSEAISHQRH